MRWVLVNSITTETRILEHTQTCSAPICATRTRTSSNKNVTAAVRAAWFEILDNYAGYEESGSLIPRDS